MSKLTLLPAQTPDGQELTDEVQDELLCSEELLSFSHTKRDRDGEPVLDENGQPIVLARHSMILDTSRVSSLDLIAYQKHETQIYAQAQARKADIEAQIAEATARAKRKKPATETEADQDNAEVMLQVAGTLDLIHLQRTGRAQLLAKLVSQWTVRSRGQMVEPSAEFLLGRTGPGADAYEALEEWYFPTSNGAEEETGTPESPSTPAP